MGVGLMGYENAKVYKIVCNTTGLCYIGSTIKRRLSDRLSEHKTRYKRYVDEVDSHYYSSYRVLENDDYDIILVENYPCENVNQLKARERHHIENTECVNITIPGRTYAEYYQDNIEKLHAYNRDYYENNKDYICESVANYRRNNRDKVLEMYRTYRNKAENKDKIKEYQQSYRENNKDYLCDQSKIYRENNKERLCAQKREYYEKNKERIRKQGSQKFDCECGGHYTLNHKVRHSQTRKHVKWLKEQEHEL